MTQEDLRGRVERLRRAPEEVARLLEGLSDADVRWKPSENVFSILENVCHLRDIEHDGFASRIGRLLSVHQPTLPDIDGERLATERRYNAQPLAPALEAFRSARMVNIARLSDLDAEQLARAGRLETVGPITLADLIDRMLGHDEGHLADLADLRARLARGRVSPS